MDPISSLIIGIGILGLSLAQRERERRQKERENLTNAYYEAYDNYLSAQSTVNTLDASIADLEIDILQNEANISSFDQALVRWQSQANQQRQQLQVEAESSYSQLMQNWQGAELVNATRGQTGGSAALVAESQAMQVERLAGSDMKLDQYGGMYGTMLHEINLDLSAGRNELVGNLRIYREALAKQQSILSSYRSQLAAAQQSVLDAENFMNKSKQEAIDAGVDEEKLNAYVGGAR